MTRFKQSPSLYILQKINSLKINWLWIMSVVTCVSEWCKQVSWSAHVNALRHTHTHTRYIKPVWGEWFICSVKHTHTHTHTHNSLLLLTSVLQLIRRARPVTRAACSVRLRHYFCFERESLLNVDASRFATLQWKDATITRRAQRTAHSHQRGNIINQIRVLLIHWFGRVHNALHHHPQCIKACPVKRGHADERQMCRCVKHQDCARETLTYP